MNRTKKTPATTKDLRTSKRFTVISERLCKLGKPILDFILVSSFLWAIHFCFPQVYIFLTKWANQPLIPNVKSCKLTPLDSSDLIGLPGLSKSKRYLLNIELNVLNDQNSNAVIFTEESFLSIYPEGIKSSISNVGRSYFIIRNKHFEKQSIFSFEVTADEENANLLSEYDGNNCPVQIAFFNGRSHE